MYILKTKGTTKIPDYIQIRDDDFILVHHFRTDQVEKWNYLMCEFYDSERFRDLVMSVPYGKLVKI